MSQAFHIIAGRAVLRLMTGARNDAPVGLGDVVVIPAGAGYRFLSVQEPIAYLAVGVDVTS